MSERIGIDSVRLSDLSLMGWFGVGVSTVSIGYAAKTALVWLVVGGNVLTDLVFAGFVALLGAAIAYDNARPECEAACDACGQHIHAQSSRDGVDEYVEVHASGSPRRLRIGPLTVVTERSHNEWVYCSGDCAAADDENRFLVGHLATEANRAMEVADD